MQRFNKINLNTNKMESNKKQGTSQSNQDTSQQQPQKESKGKILIEREYLKILGGEWDWSKAGKTFVMQLPKRSSENAEEK